MDFLAHFRRECLAFEAAARNATGDPTVPSCPEWTMTGLVAHLGWVQRYVTHLIVNRIRTPPDPAGGELPRAVPDADWFAEGARNLAGTFADTDPGVEVWTWSAEHTVGFWLRMQTIEAAVHRWDAENTIGTPQPVDAELAAYAVGQTFEVMVPYRRATQQAPAGHDERFRFLQTDGPGDWTVHFHGDTVDLTTGPAEVELSGTASELMLALWQRLPRPELSRYFTLAPPV